MTSHDGGRLTTGGITVWPPLMAVRRRPLMYFGVDRHDPALPGQVLRWAACLAAADPGGLVSRVEVVIESDLVFSVRDNGAGLAVDRIRPQREPWVAEALTSLFAGHGPVPAGTGLAWVTAYAPRLSRMSGGTGGITGSGRTGNFRRRNCRCSAKLRNTAPESSPTLTAHTSVPAPGCPSMRPNCCPTPPDIEHCRATSR
jgi:hypothetical protein